MTSASQMSQTSSTSTVRLIAVALADETTWWLGEPRNTRLFSDDSAWKACMCCWLYPVDTSPDSFADVPGFQPTSSIYEVGQDGFSKVLHSAALADDVIATKVTINRVSYVFVPQEQVKRIDLIYKVLLRREAAGADPAALVSSTASVPPQKEESAGKHASRAPAEESERAQAGTPHADERDAVNEELLPRRSASGDAAELAQLGIAQGHASSHKAARQDQRSHSSNSWRRDASVSSSDSEASMSSRVNRGHQRRRPLEGTTVIVAPHLSSPQGNHASNEVFSWPKHYIAHVGSADYLCPAATGNTYGFRLDKVTNTGFPVFLLFGSPVKSSYSFPQPVNGVPVHESTTLHGEGSQTTGMNRRVLVCTRLVSKKGRSGHTAGGHTHRDAVREHEDGDGDSDMGYDEEIEEADSAAGAEERPSRKRHRPSGSHHKRDDTNRKRAKHSDVVVEAPLNPLTAVSVNLWSEPQTAIAPIAELASRHPFSSENVVGMQTAVFPDGTCVTYSAGTAAKYASHVSSTKKGASSGGGGASTNALDEDMRGLLENIELARLQSSASSS